MHPLDDGKGLGRLDGKYQKTSAIREYLIANNIQVWLQLREIRDKMWDSKSASQYFSRQRKAALHSRDSYAKSKGYILRMAHVAHEIQIATKVFTMKSTATQSWEPVRALDVCMCPGAFAQYFLHMNPSGLVDGLSLPIERGGYDLMLNAAKNSIKLAEFQAECRAMKHKNWQAQKVLKKQYMTKAVEESIPESESSDPESPISLTWTDITLQVGLLPSGKDLPEAEDFPEMGTFMANAPLPIHLQEALGSGKGLYDLVICDGHLRTPDQTIGRTWDPARLIVAQTIWALTFIKPGGSVLILLHRLEKWNTFITLYQFSKFSKVRLFKPKTAYGTKSSFYLVGTNVQPESEQCRSWVEELKRTWYTLTFGGENGYGAEVEAGENFNPEEVLKEWGAEYVKLAKKIWGVQKKGLEELWEKLEA